MVTKKALALIMAVAMITSMSSTVFAEEITTDGGESAVPVPLTAEAATFSVTVPVSLPISVDAAGVVTVSNETKIVNNSYGAVKVTDMTIAAQNSWATVDFDTANMAAEKVGSKKLAMVINNQKTTGADKLTTFSEANFPRLEGVNDTDSDELPIVYDAKVPAQATALTDETVANVTFVIGWDTVAEVIPEP